MAPPWECAGTVAAAAGGVEAAVTVAAAAAVAVAVVEVVAVAVAGAEDSQQHEDVTYLSNLLPHPSPAIIKPDIVLRFNPSQTENIDRSLEPISFLLESWQIAFPGG